MIASGSARLLELLNKKVLREVPKGWKTAKQWADEKNRSESHMSRMLREGVKQGVVEMDLYSTGTNSGQFRPTPHYRIKKELAPKGK